MPLPLNGLHQQYLTWVVEAMGEFVPDHHPDASVVEGGQGVVLVERNLEDAGQNRWENKLVGWSKEKILERDKWP